MLHLLDFLSIYSKTPYNYFNFCHRWYQPVHTILYSAKFFFFSNILQKLLHVSLWMSFVFTKSILLFCYKVDQMTQTHSFHLFLLICRNCAYIPFIWHMCNKYSQFGIGLLTVYSVFWYMYVFNIYIIKFIHLSYTANYSYMQQHG